MAHIFGSGTQPLLAVQAMDVAEGVFSGYASRFNQIDQSGDEIAPFAFSRSLRVRGNSGIRMLFQHNPEQPIGIWNTVKEDAQGLFVEGRIICASRLGADLFQLVKNGAIDGLSIGFKTTRAVRNPDTKIRRIMEADLWEISLVTFPLLESARIQNVKAVSPQQLQLNQNPEVTMVDRLRTVINHLQTRTES